MGFTFVYLWTSCDAILGQRNETMKIKILIAAILTTMLVGASGIEGQQAPDFGKLTWLQTNGKKNIKIDDYRGKVLYIYGFQSWCPGCHSHGFPTLRKLAEHYRGDDKVAFVAIQTVFEGYAVNTEEAAKKIIKQYKLTMPVAQSGAKGFRSEFMNRYRTGGTPWTIIVDKKGVVRFNGFRVDADKALPYIEMLKREK